MIRRLMKRWYLIREPDHAGVPEVILDVACASFNVLSGAFFVMAFTVSPEWAVAGVLALWWSVVTARWSEREMLWRHSLDERTDPPDTGHTITKVFGGEGWVDGQTSVTPATDLSDRYEESVRAARRSHLRPVDDA